MNEIKFPTIWAYYSPERHDYKRANGRIRTYSSREEALKQKKHNSDAILVKLTAEWDT